MKHGCLGCRVRKDPLTCVKEGMKSKFPDEDGIYVGFKHALLSNNDDMEVSDDAEESNSQKIVTAIATLQKIQMRATLKRVTMM